MMTGNYLAGRGVQLESSSKYVMANAFATTAGDKLGVLVWNVSEEESATYNVAYPGYRAVSVCAPDKEDVKLGDALAPASIHLVMFEKQ